MPIVQITIKIESSLGFTALRSIIIDGKDNVVTPIIKEKSICFFDLLYLRLT